MNLLKRFGLNQEYFYSGKLEELENKILILDGLNVEKVVEKKYKLYATFCFGTISLAKSLGIEGINVVASITENDLRKQKICFTSKPRPELYLIAGTCILFIIVAMKQHEPLQTYLIGFGAWIGTHLWFQWIFRKQEKAVISRAVEQLYLIGV